MSKIILDIDIVDTHNSMTIGVADISTYDPSIPIANPNLEVIPPGGFSKMTLPFTPKSINILNSNLVGLSVACNFDSLQQMPDGIWSFKYSINPNLTMFVSLYYMRTTLINCKLQNQLLRNLMDTKSDPIKIKQTTSSLLDVSLMIDGSIAAANRGDVATSNSLYNKANSVLDNLANQKCNNCG